MVTLSVLPMCSACAYCVFWSLSLVCSAAMTGKYLEVIENLNEEIVHHDLLVSPIE